jgi:hypothetical protein
MKFPFEVFTKITRDLLGTSVVAASVSVAEVMPADSDPMILMVLAFVNLVTAARHFYKDR